MAIVVRSYGLEVQERSGEDRWERIDRSGEVISSNARTHTVDDSCRLSCLSSQTRHWILMPSPPSPESPEYNGSSGKPTQRTKTRS